MFGSKIDNLIKLQENGFNVPKFEILKFDDCIKNKHIIEEIITRNLENKELSKKLKGFIEENTVLNLDKTKFNKKYAVRSSANIEDGIVNSFAGQFDTYLNVTPDLLEEYIIKCFKSLYNENALEYCAKDISTWKMNVIIQEMVESELSGVVFTANPQGILNESVIVVGEGLGENIVTDKVETTSYFYNNTDNVYYFEGKNDYLSKERIDEMIKLSKKIENVIDKNLDIEFAVSKEKIYILQARKITTIDDSNPLILDNSNIVESYPNLSLPFTISFVHSVYGGVFKGVSYRILKSRKVLSKYEDVFKNMVGNANGRIYYKISNWYTLIKFLPFNKKIIPVWQEMMGVKIKAYDENVVDLNAFMRFRTYINSFYELLTVQKHMRKLNKKFIEINNEFYSSIKDNMNAEQVLSLYKRIEDELLACWDVTLLNDIYTFAFTGLVKSRLKKKYENYEEKANEYISGISNIESLKPIKELVKLAYEKDNLNKEEYENRFNRYIDKYGDRNLEELKIESLTFRSNPELLSKKIDEYREDKNKLNEIYDQLIKKEDSFKIKEDFITRFLIKKCMAGISNREISRLNRSRIYGMVRKMILQIGEIYQKQQIIDKQRDIFYLTFDEIKQLSKDGKDMREVISSRKSEYEMYKLLPAYSRIIFDKNEFDKKHVNINMKKLFSDNAELKGIPCSNGIVEGEALVINDVNEAGNVKDKILITKMTDPGWVFLLATAKGVIAEKGSLLSHTAIVSRELKIPSIVGVDGLMKTVSTGDIIKMNGTTGEINIINKKER